MAARKGIVPQEDLKLLLVYRYTDPERPTRGFRRLLTRLPPQLTVQQVLGKLKRDGFYRLEWRDHQGRTAYVLNYRVEDGRAVRASTKFTPRKVTVGTLLDLEQASEQDLENDE